jgi:hypothetical protein
MQKNDEEHKAFSLRLPPDLHRAMREAADKSFRTMQREIQFRLQQSLVAEKKAART